MRGVIRIGGKLSSDAVVRGGNSRMEFMESAVACNCNTIIPRAQARRQ